MSTKTMSQVSMSRFGAILTGRDFGQKAMRELEAEIEYPVVLDFSDTMSLGSSFGDETVVVLAKKQGGKISVINPNAAVGACLQKLGQDHGIAIEISHKT